MEITVRATARGHRPPELAVLQADATHESAHHGEAVARATATLRRLVDGLDQVTSGITRRIVLPVHTRSWRPWSDQGTQLDMRHEATGRVEVEVDEFDLLARLAHDWAHTEGVALSSPLWLLSAATERALDAELTREAIVQARERAQVMAVASGFSTVTPLQLADTGLLGEASPMLQARQFRADGHAKEVLDLVPREIERQVTVEARFRAS